MASTQIDEDAEKLLAVLEQAPRNEFVKGVEVARLSGLAPDRVNDAVALLVDSGHAEWVQTFGTAPFDFNSVRITSRGRQEYQRLKAAQPQVKQATAVEPQEVTGNAAETTKKRAPVPGSDSAGRESISSVVVVRDPDISLPPMHEPITRLNEFKYSELVEGVLDAAFRVQAKRGLPVFDTGSLVRAFVMHAQAFPSQGGATGWLMNAAGLGHVDLGIERLEQLRLRTADRDYPKTGEMTGECYATILLASRIAEDTTLTRRIGGRHLLAAILILEPADPINARKLLKQWSVDVPELRQELLRALPSWGLVDDNLNVWRAILTEPAAYVASGIIPTSPTPSAPRAFDTRVRRHATDHEVCLSADEYAATLAEFFNASDDEFCFGLFGHWGRGKTFLMQRVEKKLGELHDRDPQRHKKYQTIRFSAWKYPSTPQLWVHLYETFAESCLKDGFVTSLARTLRAGLAKHGVLVILFSLAVFDFVLFSASIKLQAVAYFAQIFGAGGLLLVWGLVSAGRGLRKRVARQFLSLARHEEQLGLQAVVGKDMQALLVGWFYKARGGCAPVLNRAFGALALSGFGLLVVLGTLAVVFRGVLSEDAGSVVLCADMTDERNQLWLRFALATTLPLLATIFYIVTRWVGAHADRILLVVDDLDRCPPEQLLHVVESLKLFLEDDDVVARVQVAMLIDEAALSHALLTKYQEMAKQAGGPKSILLPTCVQLVQENIEKIFISHLRLPNLVKGDLEAVMQKIVEQGEVRTKPPGRASVVTQTSAVVAASQDPQPEGGLGAAPLVQHTPIPAMLAAGPSPVLPSPVRGPVGPKPTDPVLTEEDATALLQSVGDLVTEDATLRAGPRSVRCFVARYQLARLLLKRLGKSYDPSVLAKALATYSRFDPNVATPVHRMDPEVESIVQQVSLPA